MKKLKNQRGFIQIPILIWVIVSVPPKVGRTTNKLPNGKWRKVMATRFSARLYGQRWQVETVNSMIKRNLGSFLRARSYWSQCREIMLRLFVHNVMIVRG